ncbi:MAG TPA: ABC transporter substrate-binding protein [Acetobacteraceae bacterium]|nr:ABC transporter substrate-binding protein [Acetobacteraceae bacterium]
MAGAVATRRTRAANTPGVTATEIKIGQTMPYSGPVSNYATIGRAEQAYFAMVNSQGGINGRKITLLSRDDAYSPPKTVEQIRALVEDDQVAFIFQSLGDVTNAAIQRYLNDRRIPQLFLADGSSKWDDPRHFPWTMAWQPSYRTESHVDARFILERKPNARIGILVQDSLGGRDGLAGFTEALGDKANTMIVKKLTYQATDATIDSQIETLHASGADTFLNYSVPKFVAQAIRRIHNLDWRPLHILASVSSSVSETLEPAGSDNATGILSVGFLKDPNDPRWRGDPGVTEWRDWMGKYYPEGNTRDIANVYAYMVSQTLVQVLRQCADDLSRENVMRQAANLRNLALPLLLPGIKINTSPDDYRPVKQMQPIRFNGRNWDLFGEVIAG